jgi:hypothetical protein
VKEDDRDTPREVPVARPLAPGTRVPLPPKAPPPRVPAPELVESARKRALESVRAPSVIIAEPEEKTMPRSLPPTPPAAPAPPRSITPPGGAKLSTKWGTFSAPGPVFVQTILIVGVLALVGYYVRDQVGQVIDELRDVKKLMVDVAKQGDETRAEGRETKRELAGVKDYLREKAAWDAALEASRGNRIRQPDGAPPLPDIQVEKALAPRPSPQVTVKTPPPPVP